MKDEALLVDPGCAERGCMGYSPFSGDTECEQFYHEDVVEALRKELRTANNRIQELEQQIYGSR